MACQPRAGTCYDESAGGNHGDASHDDVLHRLLSVEYLRSSEDTLLTIIDVCVVKEKSQRRYRKLLSFLLYIYSYRDLQFNA
jgi:hypothetical protein